MLVKTNVEILPFPTSVLSCLIVVIISNSFSKDTSLSIMQQREWRFIQQFSSPYYVKETQTKFLLSWSLSANKVVCLYMCIKICLCNIHEIVTKINLWSQNLVSSMNEKSHSIMRAQNKGSDSLRSHEGWKEREIARITDISVLPNLKG